jgi:hypothetical protein
LAKLNLGWVAVVVVGVAAELVLAQTNTTTTLAPGTASHPGKDKPSPAGVSGACASLSLCVW